MFAAEAGRIEDVEVHALVSLVAVLADQRKFEDARAMSGLAGAASSRLSDLHAVRADLLSADAWVLCRDGKYDESALRDQADLDQATAWATAHGLPTQH